MRLVPLLTLMVCGILLSACGSAFTGYCQRAIQCSVEEPGSAAGSNFKNMSMGTCETWAEEQYREITSKNAGAADEAAGKCSMEKACKFTACFDQAMRGTNTGS
ncbi:MAG: hypothetical protein GMKNLPBB_01728 [Myxococcota bacterium]|nr:hypothetical protein [Myxococcota bacterium]